MTTYLCPECGHISSEYKAYWEYDLARTEGGFEYWCTEDWDIRCRACSAEFCMEHEDCENYVHPDNIIMED